MASRCDFNYTLQLPFEAANTGSAYLHIIFCCFGATREEMIPLARAKTRVSRLPLNASNAFKLPMHSMENRDQVLFYVTMSGIIDPPASPSQDPAQMRMQGSGAIFNIHRKPEFAPKR
jgi:hypothetical protein